MKISQHKIIKKLGDFFVYRVRQQIECMDDMYPVITGKTVGVAILDTGIGNHPDFQNRVLDFYDFVQNRKGIYDDSGHGTHVVGCIGGSGKISRGKYRGIHPECNFVIGKVLNADGDGNLSDMIKGFEWILDCAEKYNICVVNISVGVTGSMDQDALEIMLGLVETAWQKNILVVCAAGNNGPKPMSISPLGAGKHIITVGCHDGGYFGNRENICERYSGRGASRFAIKKPDLVAPGTDIISCALAYLLKKKMLFSINLISY